MRKMLAGLLAGVLLLSGCTAQAAAKSDDTAAVAQQPAENAAVQGGFTENQTLDGADGIIHFSYYLPDGYDSAKTYPLIVAMPGYPAARPQHWQQNSGGLFLRLWKHGARGTGHRGRTGCGSF